MEITPMFVLYPVAIAVADAAGSLMKRSLAYFVVSRCAASGFFP
jgi:tellurite resistance protein TehA-like permease